MAVDAAAAGYGNAAGAGKLDGSSCIQSYSIVTLGFGCNGAVRDVDIACATVDGAIPGSGLDGLCVENGSLDSDACGGIKSATGVTRRGYCSFADDDGLVAMGGSRR